MTLSRLTLDAHSTAFRSNGRISWKFASLIGIPLGIAGVALVLYYMKRKNDENRKTDHVAKTPLDIATSLKARGNKFFKGGKYEQAISNYLEALKVCPEDAIEERAFLYQNLAAAKENQRQYEAAVEDCTAALELKPVYIKALSRRARLYKHLNKLDEWLMDTTACCILEEYKNMDNIQLLDEAMKKISFQKAELARANLSHDLPSDSYIKNYLSAFSWNPFTLDSEPLLNTATNGLINPNEEVVDSPFNDLKDPLRSALRQLSQALESLNQCDYTRSMNCVTESVQLFKQVLADPSLLEITTTNPRRTVPDAGVGENVDADIDAPDAPKVTNDGIRDVKIDQNGETATEPPQYQLEKPVKAAYNKALLLLATYEALCGYSESAKERFQAIGNDNSGASVAVQVNALIKSACLSMSIEQDMAACLYDFQRAESVCAECPDVYIHRGQINLLADQLDQALHDLTTAVKLKPEFTPAQAQRLFILYRIAMEAGDKTKTASRVDEFKKLATKYPKCQETCSLYAQILSDGERFEECDEVFSKLISLCPDNGMTYAYRALHHIKWRKQCDAAREILKEGVKVDPKCELIHELLGQTAVEEADFPAALEHFNAAIQQVKTKQDLNHLISMREGVSAQMRVCEKYNITPATAISRLQRRQEILM